VCLRPLIKAGMRKIRDCTVVDTAMSPDSCPVFFIRETAEDESVK